MPKLSIVTPTIVRSTLERLCSSIDKQTYSDYEHLLIVDIPFRELTKEQKFRLEHIVRSGDNRAITFCQKRHQNYGNTCRHNAAPLIKGDYVLYIDDDDILASNEVLQTLSTIKSDWAVFPILRYGRPYLVIPPGICKTGNAMYIYKRDMAVYPDVPTYEADGMLVEELMKKAPYEVLKCQPLVIMEASHHGRDFDAA